jgi:hypothetical protein
MESHGDRNKMDTTADKYPADKYLYFTQPG